jgi:carbonyl reductase 1
MSKTALVTGANRGLGLETVKQLAARGLSVILTSRGSPPAGIDGASIVHRSLDVSDRASIAALARALAEDRVTLDLLVNNAGIAMDGFNAAVARKTVDVNFFGAMYTTDALQPMIRDGGQIVMVSSGLGELDGLPRRLFDAFSDAKLTRERLVDLVEEFVSDVEGRRHKERGWPSSGYRVSKIAMNALARILARELAPRKIRVNAVCPGWVQTDMGGAGATRTVEEGAASIVATAVSSGATGTFYRDGERIDW